MSTPAQAWLAGRAEAGPAGLATALAAALARGGDNVPEQLVAGAADSLRTALAHGDARVAAWHLLAADALLTHAFEAASELGPGHAEAVAELCERLLGELAEEA